MRTLLWFVEHVPLNSVFLPLNLRSNTYCKKSFQFSASCLKMSKMPSESCASNLWSQWPSISRRRKIKSILWELYWPLVRINPGRSDLLLPKTSQLLQTHSERKLQITTLSKLSLFFWMITKLKSNMLPLITFPYVCITCRPRRSATSCCQLFKTPTLKVQPNSKPELHQPWVKWPSSSVRIKLKLKSCQCSKSSLRKIMPKSNSTL